MIRRRGRIGAYGTIVALVLVAWAVSCAGAVVTGATVRVECLAAPSSGAAAPR